MLDDLHWADPDSLLLTAFLASAIRDSPILLVIIYREVHAGRDHPLRSLFGALAREPHCERLPLRGLERDEVRQLVESITGEPLDAEFARLVFDMTEGNPFFVRELAQLLADSGSLALDSSNQLSHALPESVRDAIGRRLDSLSAECNEVLRSAAVLGREFSGRLLAEICGEPHEQLLELLGEALAGGVLTEHQRLLDGYAFSHELVRQTLYEELGVPHRVVSHQRAADALERLHAESAGEHLAELAHHLFQSIGSGDAARAVEVSIGAAEHASRQRAYDEALKHYNRAIEALALIEAPDDGQRCRLVLAAAEACWAAGHREKARLRFAEAAEIARRLDDPALLVSAAVGLRGYGEMSSAPDAETLRTLDEALAAVGDEHPTLRARVLSRLACSEPHSRSMQTRQDLSGEAYELTKSCEEPGVLYDVTVARYWSTLGPDSPKERAALGLEAVDLGHRHGEPRLRLLGYEALIAANLMLGDFETVGRHVALFEEEAKALRQPLFEFLALATRGAYEMNRGSFATAEGCFDRAIELGRGTVPFAEIMHNGVRFWLQGLRGDPRDPEIWNALVENLRERRPATTIDHLVSAGVASTQYRLGNHEVAAELLRELMNEGVEGLERDEHWFLTMSSLSDTAIGVEDVGAAEVLHKLLLPYEELMLTHDLVRGDLGQRALGAGCAGRRRRAQGRGRRPAAARARVGAGDRGDPGGAELAPPPRRGIPARGSRRGRSHGARGCTRRGTTHGEPAADSARPVTGFAPSRRSEGNDQVSHGTRRGRAGRMASLAGGVAVTTGSFDFVPYLGKEPQLDIPPLAERPKRDLRKAFRCFREVSRDPDQSEIAIEMSEALGGYTDDGFFQLLASTVEGRRMLRDQPCLATALADREALARLPEGSLGREYLAFAEIHGFAADGLLESRYRAVGDEGPKRDPYRAWYGDRAIVLHDLQHVLTGYRTDRVGEGALLVFSLGQGETGPGARLLGNLSIVFTSNLVRRFYLEARRRGKRAKNLWVPRYEDMLHLPLRTVREALGIEEAELSHHYRMPEMIDGRVLVTPC